MKFDNFNGRWGSSRDWMDSCRCMRLRRLGWMIRVNRQPVAHNQMLCDGDRISITPVKIEGACGRFIEASR